MTAKEMFKKLGYKLDKQEDYLVYWKVAKKQRINFYHNQNEIQIEFNLHYKTIEKRELMNLDENSNIITLAELQAINKQVEELGWLDTKLTIDPVTITGEQFLKNVQRLNDCYPNVKEQMAKINKAVKRAKGDDK